jgi:hypothetical protein
LKTTLSLLFLSALIISFSFTAKAQVQRIVLVKVDGLPADEVDRFVNERDARTGKSLLPWIERVFYQRGTRLANFYVRGMSLSAPSWSMLDTGQHLQIKGNVEFDRLTLHSYDYLNFVPFYLASARQKRIDMPGVEVLDETGTPLLFDAFAPNERFISFQLYQRGIRWTTLEQAVPNHFKRSPRDLIDEWTIGLESRDLVFDELEREVALKLNDPRYRYLDLYVTEFDHTAHHNRDRESHLYALQDLDALVGRVWTAIERSPQAAETALVLVSDHGFNSDPRVYSQGFNLVKLLGSREGGGHHVITKRRLMMDYAIKGVYPLVPLITTTTPKSFYLKGQSTSYPTALLDFDGNERASFHLRDSNLNVLHILLQQLQRKDISQAMRQAVTDAFFKTLDAHRDEWQNELEELREEVGALHRLIEQQRAEIAAQPKRWTEAESKAGRDAEARRLWARMDSNMSDERDYDEYLRTLGNLVGLRRESFAPARLKIEDVIAKGAMGNRNSIYNLQNYVVGIAPAGMILNGDGSLDLSRSFVRVDYFTLLKNVAVRNNVQPRVSNRPIDFIATRIPHDIIAPNLENDLHSAGDAVWLYGGESQQALILSRVDASGGLSLRYVPIANLKQDAQGKIKFQRVSLEDGLPLQIWEDEQVNVPTNERAAWLEGWHTDLEWLRALHKSAYSNALIGLHEQITQHAIESLNSDATGLSADARLLRRFRQRQRRLTETDLLLLANNHWNFDVRGFNPGGNHGSFFRASTHATLMFAGGERTGIPRGAVVEDPYDSLSFVPTALALMNQLRDGNAPDANLSKRGFYNFPGRIIEQVLGNTSSTQPPSNGKGAADAP